MSGQEHDTESIVKQVMDRLKGARREYEDDGEDVAHLRGKSVPYERFQQLVQKNRDLLGKLDEFTTDVNGLGTRYRSDLQAAVQAHESALGEVRTKAADEVKALTARFGEDLALHDAGLTDPAGRKALRDAWETTPKDARGENPLAYWNSINEARKAHAADPEKAAAPEFARTLQGYLPEIAAPGGDKGRAGGAGKAKQPGVDSKVVNGRAPTILEKDYGGDYGALMRDLDQLDQSTG